MSKKCTVCDRDLDTLPEEGCPDCGLEYDPLQPDNMQALDFNKEITTDYRPGTDILDELEFEDL